jgi:hypothetical protein
MTAERFARGLTWDDYVRFTGSPENLAREGFDIRRFSTIRPRLDWSGYLRERYGKTRLTDQQASAIRWLAAQPGGPAPIAVLAEEWSSDCRRDLPYLVRLAEAGGLELRVFVRDGDVMLRKGLPDPAAGGNADLVVAFGNDKNGQRFASVPVAVSSRATSSSCTVTSSTRRCTTRTACSVTCARPGRARRRSRPERVAAARSARCWSRPSSTCGRTPRSRRSSAPSTSGW